MPTLESDHKRTPGFDSKRLHLLETAARVFSEVGYDKASMRLIAAEAEVSLAGIYHYVACKEELLYWIQFHTFDSLLRDLEASLEGVSEPRQRIATAVRNHVRHFGENMHELKVCARELETIEGEAYDAVHELRRSYFEAVHRLVKELQPRRGADLDSWLATANLFGMINWTFTWLRAGGPLSYADMAPVVTQIVLNGLNGLSDSPGRGKKRTVAVADLTA